MKIIVFLFILGISSISAYAADVRTYISDDGMSERFVVSERESDFMAKIKSRRRARAHALRLCEQNGWNQCEVISTHTNCRKRVFLFTSTRICQSNVAVLGTH